MMRKARVLVTDVDNTLFDWVDIWYSSFRPMFDQIQVISGVNPEQIKSEIRDVHRKHGTSEYSFLIEEIPCLCARFPSENLLDVFAPAIEAFRQARRNALRLYIQA